MLEELKIKIQDYRKMENYLKKLGAKFSRELNVVDTYFKQPIGEVLKITEDESGDFLVKLKSKNGKFEILKYEKTENVAKLKEKFANIFGVKRILKKRRRFFEFKNYKLNINLIEGVGKFLIVEGENLSPEIFTRELNIKNPEFIKVSFDELKRETTE